MPISEGPFQNLSLLHSDVATAVITGTASSSDENDIVAGGETIIITLSGKRWVDAGTTFDNVRQDIIDGLDSAQSETTGWNNEVRDNLAVSTVVRTSDSIVTITLSAQAAYEITADEVITVTVPASAIYNSGTDAVGTPNITILDVSVLPYTWSYHTTTPFGAWHFRSGLIPYSGSFYGTLDLASGESLDFDNTPAFSGPFGIYWQRSSGSQIFTIADNTTTAQYYITKNGDNFPSRNELAVNTFGLSTDIDQTCDLT